ncbi:MAG TPA: response regulator, partial [Candidatus Acidoferrales bacterium]
MAKILVADDNSNVQKTMALALSDLGIEVIAVNNGDAAVKKLADVMPDLVLADIFMPVRNGYEVCEYVKKDSRFSHMPVVLLVGAFDPLDEREAQRVGADGILKKPFVPPDPLIAMVKTLLERKMGERLVTAAVAKPAAVAQPVSVGKQSRSGGVAVADEQPSSLAPIEISPEPEEVNFNPPVDRLSFGDGDRPIAFSQLLDSPSSESAGTGVLDDVDDEQILTSSRDASLGEPIFWKKEEAEPELDPESDEAQEKVTSEVPMGSWKLGDEDSGDTKEIDSAESSEHLELVRDDDDEVFGNTSTIVESAPLRVHDAASQASLTVESAKPDDLAANPIEWMASAPPHPEEESPAVLPEWGAAVAEAAELMGTKEIEPEVFKSESKPLVKEVPAIAAVPVS